MKMNCIFIDDILNIRIVLNYYNFINFFQIHSSFNDLIN